MSELRSVIDGFRSEVVVDLPDARVEDDLLELQAAVEALEAERLRRLAEFDRRELFALDGHLSAASWMVARCRAGWGAARADLRVARAFAHMPKVAEALAAGEVSLGSARVLAEARQAEPEAFAGSEDVLLEAAIRHTVADLQRVVAHWQQRVETERYPGRDVLFERRRLHASATLGGMVRVDGDLDPETGEALLSALRAVVDAEVRLGDGDDSRSPAQRRADALGQICRGWLDGGSKADVSGERPHVNLTVPLALLTDRSPAGGSFRGAELDHVGPIGESLARYLACDASVSRVVLGPRSEPLDVGRRTPVVPTAMRRAVVVRDRRCRFPGCDRPHTWCDAHHIVHWARGGPTSLQNLVLLCRRHHRLVHERFGLELVDGQPVFRRTDGSVLAEDRAPP